MPSIDIKDLFERLMEDPDYIGKENIALAEAKQRAIQSMNNHKALSMAKAVTPTEDLLEFLIQKAAGDYWKKDAMPGRGESEDQFRGRVVDETPEQRRERVAHNRQVYAKRAAWADESPHSLVTPAHNTTSHEDLLNHLKEELLSILPRNVSWEDLVKDPSRVINEATRGDGNFINRFKGFLDQINPNEEGKVQGREALDLLRSRAVKQPEDEEANEGEKLIDQLQELAHTFNIHQGALVRDADEAKETEEGIDSPEDTLLGGVQGRTLDQLLSGGPTMEGLAFRKPEGLSTSPGEWIESLRSVLNGDWKEGLDVSRWNDDGYITQGGEGQRQLDTEELRHQDIQTQLRSLARSLTGEEPVDGNGKPSAMSAYNVLNSIMSSPNQFLAMDENNRPRFTQMQNGMYYPTDRLNQREVNRSRESREAQRDNALQNLIEHVGKVADAGEDVFTQPSGTGRDRTHNMSPIMRHKLSTVYHPGDTSPEDKRATRDNFIQDVLDRHQAEQHPDNSSLSALMNEIAERKGLQFGHESGELLEQEADHKADEAVREETPEPPDPDLHIHQMDMEELVQAVTDETITEDQFNAEIERKGLGNVTQDLYGNQFRNYPSIGQGGGVAPKTGDVRSYQMPYGVEVGEGQEGRLLGEEEKEFGTGDDPDYGEAGQVGARERRASDASFTPTTESDIGQVQADRERSAAEGEDPFVEGGGPGDRYSDQGVAGTQQDLDEEDSDFDSWTMGNHIKVDSPLNNIRRDADTDELRDFNFDKDGIPGKDIPELSQSPLPRISSEERTQGLKARQEPLRDKQGRPYNYSPMSEEPRSPTETGGVQTQMGNISLEGVNSRYPGESKLSAFTKDGSSSYRKYRDFMGLLINAGFPIEDFTAINDNGQRVWSEGSMITGLQKHGFLNYEDDNKPRTLNALTKGKRQPSSQQMGIAPLLPGWKTDDKTRQWTRQVVRQGPRRTELASNLRLDHSIRKIMDGLNRGMSIQDVDLDSEEGQKEGKKLLRESLEGKGSPDHNASLELHRYLTRRGNGNLDAGMTTVLRELKLHYGNLHTSYRERFNPETNSYEQILDAKGQPMRDHTNSTGRALHEWGVDRPDYRTSTTPSKLNIPSSTPLDKPTQAPTEFARNENGDVLYDGEGKPISFEQGQSNRSTYSAGRAEWIAQTPNDGRTERDSKLVRYATRPTGNIGALEGERVRNASDVYFERHLGKTLDRLNKVHAEREGYWGEQDAARARAAQDGKLKDSEGKNIPWPKMPEGVEDVVNPAHPSRRLTIDDLRGYTDAEGKEIPGRIGQRIYDEHGRLHQVDKSDDDVGVKLTRIDGEGNEVTSDHTIELKTDSATGKIYPIKVSTKLSPNRNPRQVNRLGQLVNVFDSPEAEQRHLAWLDENSETDVSSEGTEQENFSHFYPSHPKQPQHPSSDDPDVQQAIDGVLLARRNLVGNARERGANALRSRFIEALGGSQNAPRSIDWVDIAHWLAENNYLSPEEIEHPHEMFGSGFNITQDEIDRFENHPKIKEAGIKIKLPDPETQPSPTQLPANYYPSGEDAPMTMGDIAKIRARIRLGATEFKAREQRQPDWGQEVPKWVDDPSVEPPPDLGALGGMWEIFQDIKGKLFGDGSSAALKGEIISGLDDLEEAMHNQSSPQSDADVFGKYLLEHPEIWAGHGESQPSDLTAPYTLPDTEEGQKMDTIRQRLARFSEGEYNPLAEVNTMAADTRLLSHWFARHIREEQQGFGGGDPLKTEEGIKAIKDYVTDEAWKNRDFEGAWLRTKERLGDEGFKGYFNALFDGMMTKHQEKYAEDEAARAERADDPDVSTVDKVRDATEARPKELGPSMSNVTDRRVPTYEGIQFGNRQYTEAIRAGEAHDKAVEEGYDGEEPLLEHFNSDGTRTADAPMFAHDRKRQQEEWHEGIPGERDPARAAWEREQPPEDVPPGDDDAEVVDGESFKVEPEDSDVVHNAFVHPTNPTGTGDVAELPYSTNIDGKDVNFSKVINGPGNRRMLVAEIDGQRRGFYYSHQHDLWRPFDGMASGMPTNPLVKDQPLANASWRMQKDYETHEDGRPTNYTDWRNHGAGKGIPGVFEFSQFLDDKEAAGEMPSPEELAQAGHGSEEHKSPEYAYDMAEHGAGHENKYDHDGSRFSNLELNSWLGTDKSMTSNTAIRSDDPEGSREHQMAIHERISGRRNDRHYDAAPEAAEPEAAAEEGETHVFDDDGLRVDAVTGDFLFHPNYYAAEDGLGALNEEDWAAAQSDEPRYDPRTGEQIPRFSNKPLEGSPRAGMPFDTPITRQEYTRLVSGVRNEPSGGAEEREETKAKYSKLYGKQPSVEEPSADEQPLDAPTDGSGEEPPIDGDVPPTADGAPEEDEGDNTESSQHYEERLWGQEASVFYGQRQKLLNKISQQLENGEELSDDDKTKMVDRYRLTARQENGGWTKKDLPSDPEELQQLIAEKKGMGQHAVIQDFKDYDKTLEDHPDEHGSNYPDHKGYAKELHEVTVQPSSNPDIEPKIISDIVVQEITSGKVYDALQENAFVRDGVRGFYKTNPATGELTWTSDEEAKPSEEEQRKTQEFWDDREQREAATEAWLDSPAETKGDLYKPVTGDVHLHQLGLSGKAFTTPDGTFDFETSTKHGYVRSWNPERDQGAEQNHFVGLAQQHLLGMKHALDYFKSVWDLPMSDPSQFVAGQDRPFWFHPSMTNDNVGPRKLRYGNTPNDQSVQSAEHGNQVHRRNMRAAKQASFTQIMEGPPMGPANQRHGIQKAYMDALSRLKAGMTEFSGDSPEAQKAFDTFLTENGLLPMLEVRDIQEHVRSSRSQYRQHLDDIDPAIQNSGTGRWGSDSDSDYSEEKWAQSANGYGGYNGLDGGYEHGSGKWSEVIKRSWDGFAGEQLPDVLRPDNDLKPEAAVNSEGQYLLNIDENANVQVSETDQDRINNVNEVRESAAGGGTPPPVRPSPVQTGADGEEAPQPRRRVNLIPPPGGQDDHPHESDTSHPFHYDNWRRHVPQQHHEHVKEALRLLAEDRAQRDPEHNPEALIQDLKLGGINNSGAKDLVAKSRKYLASKGKDVAREQQQQKDYQFNQDRSRLQNQGTLDDVLARKQQDDPDAIITQMDATKYAREQMKFVSGIMNRVNPFDLDKPAVGRRYLPMIEQANANIHHAVNNYGADFKRLDKEAEEWGVGLGAHNRHGSDEHMEAAGTEDDRLQNQTDDYDRLMTDPYHARTHDAWNDETYNPNELHGFNSDGEHDFVSRSSYSPSEASRSGRGGINVNPYHPQDSNISAEHQHSMGGDRGGFGGHAQNSPHILGLDQDQRDRVNQLHTDWQNHGVDNSLKEQGYDGHTNYDNDGTQQKDLEQRHADLKAELKDHTIEGVHALDHPSFGTLSSNIPGSQWHENGGQRDSLSQPAPKHPHTGEGLTHLDGTGWVHHDTVRQYQNGLKPGESVFAKDMVHDDNGGVVSHMGLHIDHLGAHGADLRQEGPFNHNTIGTMDNKSLRQRETGHVMDRAITGGHAKPNTGLHVDSTGNTSTVHHVTNSPQTLTSLGDSRYNSQPYQRRSMEPAEPIQAPTQPITPPSMRNVAQQQQQPAAAEMGGVRGAVGKLAGFAGRMKQQYDVASKRSFGDILTGKNPTGSGGGDNLEKLIKHVEETKVK